MLRIFLFSFFIVFLKIDELRSQSIQKNDNLINTGLVTASTYAIVAEQQNVVKAVPVQLYSERQVHLQRLINANTAESVVVLETANEVSEWTSIDHEDITPATWQWVDLEQVHSVGDTSLISLRRPMWWLEEHRATTVGNTIFIDMPEMGIEGSATVISIRENQLDSRLLPLKDAHGYATRPITGKFIHRSNDVYSLYFDSLEKPIGVTGSHRFWSICRNTWVSAANLYIGEKVKSVQGYGVLVRREKQASSTVYNLEVYRTHNYIVSRNELLVHNECWGKIWADLYNKANEFAESEGETWDLIATIFDKPNNRNRKMASNLDGNVARYIYTGDHSYDDPKKLVSNIVDARERAWKGGKKKFLLKFEIRDYEMQSSKFFDNLEEQLYDAGFTFLFKDVESININGKARIFVTFEQDRYSKHLN